MFQKSVQKMGTFSMKNIYHMNKYILFPVTLNRILFNNFTDRLSIVGDGLRAGRGSKKVSSQRKPGNDDVMVTGHRLKSTTSNFNLRKP